MTAFDSPLLRIEIVGAVAYVLLETDWSAAVCEQHEAARRVFGQRYCLLAQIVDGVGVALFYARIGVCLSNRSGT